MTETTNPIVSSADNTVDLKDFAFHFKKDKLGNKRNSVEIQLAVPSVEGIVEILTNAADHPKELVLLQDAMYDVIRQQAASIISDDEKITKDNFPFASALWSYIANISKVDRRSSSIASEVWEAFAKDYIEVMPGVTGKSLEAIGNATQVYLKKFAQVKTNKPVLAKLKDQLALYVEHTKSGDEFAEIVDLLVSKADAYLKSDEVELLVQNL